MEKKTPRKGHGGMNDNEDFLNQLRRFDIYSKVDEDFRVQTLGGAYLSMFGWVVIAILVMAELNSFFSLEYKEHMIVDTSLREKLVINMDITFHALTCSDVHLDAMDVAGDNQLNMEQDMFKQRLSPQGKFIGRPGREIIGHKNDNSELFVAPLVAGACESCYGAESELHPCCNSCNEVRMRYKEKGWNDNIVLRNSTQCLRDSTNPFASVRMGEGCRVSGVMHVNKVAGNVHMALGTSVVRDGSHIHQFLPQDAPGFNVSHTINSLSFGTIHPGMPSNPLDSAVRMVDEETGTGLFQYFIKVIPTIYTGLYGGREYTNQYTFTEKFRPIGPPKSVDPNPPEKPAVIPGIFFVYEISPFLIEIKRIRVPLLHLFTRLCAIIGGVFSIFGVIDAIVYRAHSLFVPKK